MKKILVFAVLAFFLFHNGAAQNYNTGIGVRGGFFNGVTFKQFLSGSDALEVVGAIHYGGPFISAMYQRHTNAFDVLGLNWYYGAGAFIGFYNDARNPYWTGPGSHTGLGINGVVGLEYKIDEIPISIGLDVIPALYLFDHIRIFPAGGLTIRYVF